MLQRGGLQLIELADESSLPHTHRLPGAGQQFVDGTRRIVVASQRFRFRCPHERFAKQRRQGHSHPLGPGTEPCDRPPIGDISKGAQRRLGHLRIGVIGQSHYQRHRFSVPTSPQRIDDARSQWAWPFLTRWRLSRS